MNLRLIWRHYSESEYIRYVLSVNFFNCHNTQNHTKFREQIPWCYMVWQ